MSIVNSILGLGVSPLIVFLVFVAIDDIAGIVLAVKTKTFDGNKLPSFLASQLGTKEFIVVAVAAFTTYQTGGDVKSAATAVVIGGGFALIISLLKDIFDKVKAILGKK